MTTTIPFVIQGNEKFDVRIEIFNVLGQKIYEMNKVNLSSGKYKWQWKGTNFNNNEISSGIYFYRLTAINLKTNSNYYSKSKKLLLIK